MVVKDIKRVALIVRNDAFSNRQSIPRSGTWFVRDGFYAVPHWSAGAIATLVSGRPCVVPGSVRDHELHNTPCRKNTLKKE